MNADYEKRLEAEIDRELKALPELAPPDAVISQVMARIEQRPRMPWYQRSWQTWPTPLQISGLTVLLAMFGGLCFGGWQLLASASASSAAQQFGDWVSVLGTVWNTLNTLAGALGLIVSQLDTRLIMAGLFAVALGYIACVGLGTLYVRLAMARRE